MFINEFFGATVTLSIESWTSAIVDQILFEGDRMYLNAFERRIIPVADALSLVYLPDRARSLPIDAQRNSLPIEVTTTPNQWSPIEAKTSANQSPTEAKTSANQSPTEAEICLFCTNHSE